jgi:hypothetical protein
VLVQKKCRHPFLEAAQNTLLPNEIYEITRYFKLPCVVRLSSLLRLSGFVGFVELRGMYRITSNENIKNIKGTVKTHFCLE